MIPGERERVDAMNVRCLDLCIGILKCVNEVNNLRLLIACQPTNLGHSYRLSKKNSTLRGIFRELIVPAVESKEFVLRENGLVALCASADDRSVHGSQFIPTVLKSGANCAGGAQAARATGCI